MKFRKYQKEGLENQSNSKIGSGKSIDIGKTKIIENEIKSITIEMAVFLLLALFTGLISLFGLAYNEMILNNDVYLAIWIFSIVGFMLSFAQFSVKLMQIKDLKQSISKCRTYTLYGESRKGKSYSRFFVEHNLMGLSNEELKSRLESLSNDQTSTEEVRNKAKSFLLTDLFK